MWTRDISRAKKQLSQTLAARNKTLEPSMVGLSPSCVINEVSDEGVSWCPVPQTIKELPLAEPLFFENKLYDFELVFNREVVGSGVNSPQVRHKLQRINAKNLNDEEVKSELLVKIGRYMNEFPGYAQIYKITATLDPWEVENGLLTPTLKIKREKVKELFKVEIEQMYKGH